jgi:uncharacterized membrane protein YagU involved in acid resistance
MKNIQQWREWSEKAVWTIFDLFIIVCFMLFGMVVAEMHDYEIWTGALSGLIVHRLAIMIFRNIRDLFDPF